MCKRHPTKLELKSLFKQLNNMFAKSEYIILFKRILYINIYKLLSTWRKQTGQKLK